MNRKKLGTAALLCALAFLLTGCAGEPEERQAEDLSSLAVKPVSSAPEYDGRAGETVSAVLFYPNASLTELVPQERTVEIPEDGNRAEAILQALCEGPREKENTLWWPEEASVASVSVSNSFAAVDLSAKLRAESAQGLYAVRAAAAAALTAIDGITYADVLIGGREEGFDLAATMPLGVQETLSSADLQTQYSVLEEQCSEGGSFSVKAALYFPSEDGTLLLPEVRRVSPEQMTDIEYLYLMLEQLGGGALRSGCAVIPSPMTYISEMPEIVRTENGAYRAIDLQFSGDLDTALRDAHLTRGIYAAMLTETLMGFVPGVEGVRISIGGEAVTALSEEETPDGNAAETENGLFVRSRFDSLVGTTLTVYVPGRKTGLLRETECAVSSAEADSPRAGLSCLFALSGTQFPAGFSPDDILAVYDSGDCISVNLSANVLDTLRAMDVQEEQAAVLAMVNTLTENSRKARVEFFFNGAQADSISGRTELRGGFLRNPGTAVES